MSSSLVQMRCAECKNIQFLGESLTPCQASHTSGIEGLTNRISNMHLNNKGLNVKKKPRFKTDQKGLVGSRKTSSLKRFGYDVNVKKESSVLEQKSNTVDFLANSIFNRLVMESPDLVKESIYQRSEQVSLLQDQLKNKLPDLRNILKFDQLKNFKLFLLSKKQNEYCCVNNMLRKTVKVLRPLYLPYHSESKIIKFLLGIKPNADEVLSKKNQQIHALLDGEVNLSEIDRQEQEKFAAIQKFVDTRKKTGGQPPSTLDPTTRLFIHAIFSKDIGFIRALVKHGANVNACWHGESLLDLCINKTFLEGVKYLIEKKADIYLSTSASRKSTHFRVPDSLKKAMTKGNLRIIQLLRSVQLQAEQDQWDEIEHLRNKINEKRKEHNSILEKVGDGMHTQPEIRQIRVSLQRLKAEIAPMINQLVSAIERVKTIQRQREKADVDLLALAPEDQRTEIKQILCLEPGEGK